jgi:hypothetical protein
VAIVDCDFGRAEGLDESANEVEYLSLELFGHERGELRAKKLQES